MGQFNDTKKTKRFLILTQRPGGGVEVAVVGGLLDEHQVVGRGDPCLSPVQPEPPLPRGLHSGGIGVFLTQMVTWDQNMLRIKRLFLNIFSFLFLTIRREMASVLPTFLNGANCCQHVMREQEPDRP